MLDSLSLLLAVEHEKCVKRGNKEENVFLYIFVELSLAAVLLCSQLPAKLPLIVYFEKEFLSFVLSFCSLKEMKKVFFSVFLVFAREMRVASLSATLTYRLDYNAHLHSNHKIFKSILSLWQHKKLNKREFSTISLLFVSITRY